MKKTNNTRFIAILLAVFIGTSAINISVNNFVKAGSGIDDFSQSVFQRDNGVNPLPSLSEYTDPSGDYQYALIKNIPFSTFVSTYTTGMSAPSAYLRIDTAKDLWDLSKACNDESIEKRKFFLSLNYILGNHIDYAPFFNQDMSEHAFFPIGVGDDIPANNIPFTGIFDGQGFEISNLSFTKDRDFIAASEYFAMFGSNSGIIRNFGLVNPLLDTSSNVGEVTLSAVAGLNITGGLIEFVYVEQSSADMFISVAAKISAILGCNEQGATLSNVYYTGNVTSVTNYALIRPVLWMNYGTANELYYNKELYTLPNPNIQPENTGGTGTVKGVTSSELYTKTNCLPSDKWRRHSFEQSSGLTGYLRAFPKLYGFSGHGASWGSAAAPFKINTAADLIFLPRFLETRHTNVRGKTYHINSCIDMSAVSEDAYYFNDYPEFSTTTFIHGTASSGDDCYEKHVHTKEGTANHGIINLKLRKSVNITTLIGTTIRASNSECIGFIPASAASASAACINNLNFIGGDVIPTLNSGAAITFVGSVVGFQRFNLSDVHSSVDIIIPDGKMSKMIVGGVTGEFALEGKYEHVSYSGNIQGGIHPYNPDYDFIFAHSLGGIIGNLNESSNNAAGSDLNFLLSAGRIESFGFYDLPLTDGEFLANDACVLTGGIYGGPNQIIEKSNGDNSGHIDNTLNLSEIYSVPMDFDTGEPRTGPNSKTVYAPSLSLGGLTSYGIGLHYAKVFPIVDYISNFGDLHVYNAIGRTAVGGIQGTYYRYSHGNPFLYLANFGDITVKNSSGYLFAAGISSKLTNGVTLSFEKTANFGKITVDGSNNLKVCAVSGLFNIAGLLSSGIPGATEDINKIDASGDGYNFGEIEIINTAAHSNIYAAGILGTINSFNTQVVFDNLRNEGNIRITTAQTTGELKACGLTSTSFKNSANLGNILITGTQEMTTPVFAAGGTYHYNPISASATGTTPKSISSSLNAGQITVNVSTTDAVYAGGFFPQSLYSVTGVMSVTNCINTGDITVNNPAGTAHAGGIGAYYMQNADSEIRNNLNRAKITVTALGSEASPTTAGGILGGAPDNTTTRSLLTNNINMGNISTATTRATGAVAQYTGGIAGYYAVNHNTLSIASKGYINLGTVTSSSQTNDDSNTAAGGIFGYYKLGSRVLFANAVNHGEVSQSGGQSGAICGYVQNTAEGHAVAGSMWINQINTADGLNLYGGWSAMTSTSHTRIIRRNLFNVNPADPCINSAASAANPYNGTVEHRTADSDINGIYHEDFVMNNDPDNDCLIYNPAEKLAPYYQPLFEDGMYALTISTGYLSKLYLLEDYRLGNLDILSFNKAEYNAGKKDTSWRSEPLKDIDGNVIPASSIDSQYRYSLQVENTPVIISLQLKSDSVQGHAADTMSIAYRDDVNKILYFYSAENLLGREYYIDSYTTNMYSLYSTAARGPLSDISFSIPAAYSDGDDPRSLDLEQSVYIVNPDDPDEGAVEYKIRMQFIPNPSMELVSLRKTTLQTGTAISAFIPAETLPRDGDTYVLDEPLFTSGSNSYPIFSFRVNTVNISNNFTQYTAFTVTGDGDGLDYTSKYAFSLSSNTFSSILTGLPDNPKYVGAKNGVASNEPGGTSFYPLDNASVPEGWYTFRLTVNGRILLSIRFKKEDLTSAEPDLTGNVYKPGPEPKTAVREGSMYGLSTNKDYFYPFGSTLRAYDTMLLPKYTAVERHRLLTEIIEHPDKTHTYVNKIAYEPESGAADTQWWTLYTREINIAAMSVQNLRLNGETIGSGSGTQAEVSDKYIDNTIDFQINYTNLDLSAPQSIELYVEHIDGGVTTPLTLKSGSNLHNPTFQKEGVDFITITQTKLRSSNLIHNNNNQTEPKGEYSYIIKLLKNAGSGEYRISFVYDRTQLINMSTFDESTEEFIQNSHQQSVHWHHEFDTQLIIKKSKSDDSYIQHITNQNGLFNEIICETASHNHSSNTAVVTPEGINYGSLNTSADSPDRCDNFKYKIYTNLSAEQGNSLALMFRLPFGSKLYRESAPGSGVWNETAAENTVDFIAAPVIRYKCVSESEAYETVYTVEISDVPRNKNFNISVKSDDIPNLQNYLSQSGESLFVQLRQINSGGEVGKVINGAFIGNNGMILPYEFPSMTIGTFVIDVSVPRDCDYEISIGGVKLDEAYGGLSGYVFVATMPENTQQINMVINITKSGKAKVPWGVYTIWRSAGDPLIHIPTDAEKEVILSGDTGSLLYTDIKDTKYKNALISKKAINNRSSAFVSGRLIVNESIIGNLYSKSEIIINAPVTGDVYSETNVIINSPEGYVNGRIFIGGVLQGP